MKYEKCLSCDQLGTNCDGPNLLAMDTIDLGLWCNELRKDVPGMTYDKIAAETELSKSAVRDFLTGKHDDCSMRTARTIAKYITRGKWDDNPCGNLTNAERAAYEEQIYHLQSGIEWRDDKIKHFTEEADRLREHNRSTAEGHDKDIAFLKEQVRFKESQMQEKDKLLAERSAFMKRKDKAIAILSFLLGMCVLLIIAALIIDRTNDGVGFFWLESLFKPHSINEILQQWRT